MFQPNRSTFVRHGLSLDYSGGRQSIPCSRIPAANPVPFSTSFIFPTQTSRIYASRFNRRKSPGDELLDGAAPSRLSVGDPICDVLTGKSTYPIL